MQEEPLINIKELVDNVSNGKISSFPEFEMRVLLVGHSFDQKLFSALFKRVGEKKIYGMLVECLNRGFFVNFLKDEDLETTIKLHGTNLTVSNGWTYEAFDLSLFVKPVVLKRPKFVIDYYLRNVRKFMYGDKNHSIFEEFVYGIFKTVAKTDENFRNGLFKEIDSVHSQIRIMFAALN